MDNKIVKQAHNRLIKKGLKLAIAESCTGGLLASMLTELSGSSKYLILGLVTYSNESKTSLLKIPAALIAKKSAVSYEVAELMARNARILAKADLGVGITGIAGPAGGVAGKPVGTVFIAVNSKSKQLYQKFLFKGNRSSIRKQSALKALELLLDICL